MASLVRSLNSGESLSMFLYIVLLDQVTELILLCSHCCCLLAMTFGVPVLGGVRKPRDFSPAQSMVMFGWNLLMIGWRFHPTDEELISKHLKPKTLGKYKGDDEVIREIDVCKYEPWDLPDLSKLPSDDQEWYYLCPRDFLKNSRRTRRRTKAGFWKPTGKNLSIKARRTKTKIGTKRTLVFYRKASAKAAAVRTGWIIHEYEYIREPNLTIQGEFVLIKLKKKEEEKTQTGDQSHHNMESDVENQITPGVENQDTYCEAEPSYGMFAGQSLNEPAFGSAGTQSPVSHYMASDIENQNPNMLAAMSTGDSCLMAPDFENQYPIMLASMSTNDGGLMVSDFENQNPVMLASMSTNDGCLTASDFENQSCASEFRGESISYLETPPEFRNQPGSSGQMASMSKYQDMEAYVPAPGEDALDFGKQNPYTKSHMPTFEQIDWHSLKACFTVPEGMAMFPELNSEPQAEFTGDGIFSYFENQSPYDNSKSCCPRVSGYENQSTQNDGESSSLVATGFENQNTDKNTNISVTQEGQGNPLTSTLPDFEPPQNPCMFDLSVFGENCWSPPVASLSEHNLENYGAEQGIISPEEEWKAFLELQNCLNSNVVLQATNTEDNAKLQWH